ncbi:MAG: TerC family protein [Planctomycetaceae bacterium]|jgi:tellurite resistance protein TerC|nr:TerC family protein [Planctomycetaceae bacterium]
MSVIWLWIGFLVLVFVFLALDLGVFNRKSHVIGIGEALRWTVVWITAALIFNVGIYFMYEHHLLGIGHHVAAAGDTHTNLSGAQAAVKFFTGYLVEKSLSLDNIFVIGLVFAYFGVPAIYQHRVLFWGILGALVMRGMMIGLGSAALHQWEWLIYVFGGLLLVTAIKMLFSKHEAVHPEKNPFVRLIKRFFPVASDFHHEHFFVKIDKKLFFTPLFLVLLVVESSDVVFAIDSIPAIFGITDDPFLVFTSNIFAILGLRSLYFALAAMIQKFRYLKISLVVILLYVGAKMMFSHLIKTHRIEDLMTWISLGIIVLIMTIGVVMSILRKESTKQ